MADGVTAHMRGPDGRLLPGDGRTQVRRIRGGAVARWAATRTDMDRLSVADDFAAGAARAAARAGIDPDVELQHAIRVLWSVGERLLARLAETDGPR